MESKKIIQNSEKPPKPEQIDGVEYDYELSRDMLKVDELISKGILTKELREENGKKFIYIKDSKGDVVLFFDSDWKQYDPNMNQ